MQDTRFTCSVCGTSIQTDGIGITTGYGTNDAGEKVCFPCCAAQDEAWMREHGRIDLYLVGSKNTRTGLEVTNWPGSLRLEVKRYAVSKHNFRCFRNDVWFDFDGFEWHGIQIGERSEVCRCKKTKRAAKA